MPMLNLPGAVAAASPYSSVAAHYGAPLREQRKLSSGSALADLAAFEIIEVSGPDRLTWMNALCTQKLSDAVSGDSTELLILSPQGRIEHHAGVIVLAESLLLVTEPGCSEALLTHLEKMRFAARVEINSRSDIWCVAGLGTQAQELCAQLGAPIAIWRDPWPGITPGGIAYGDEPDEAFPLQLFLMPVSARTNFAAVSWAGVLGLEALRIAAHRPRFLAEVDQLSIPHELDWLRTAVHTSKGCYRGQESVAKVLNLGQPPRRLVLLHIDGSEETIPPSGSLVQFGSRTIGTVTAAAQHFDLGTIALACIRRNAPSDQPLTVAVDFPATPEQAAQQVVIPAVQEIIVREREHAPRPQLAQFKRIEKDLR